MARVAAMLLLWLSCATNPAQAQPQAYQLILNPESGSGWSCPGDTFWGLTAEEIGRSIRKYWNECGKGDVPGTCSPGIPSHFNSRIYTHESIVLNAGASITWHFTVSTYNILTCTIETVGSGQTIQVPKVTPTPGCVPPATQDPAAPWQCICPTCLRCVGPYCYPDDGQVPAQVSPNDCKAQYCSNGVVATRNDDAEVPTDVCKQCRSGNQVNRPDGTTPASQTQCCFQGLAVPKTGNSYEALLASCPNRTQVPDAQRMHDVDGCTAGVTSNIQDPMRGYYGDKWVGQSSTEFGRPQGYIPKKDSALPLACNLHDICYQTCGAGKNSCDGYFRSKLSATCDAAYPTQSCPIHLNAEQCNSYKEQRRQCSAYAEFYYQGVNQGWLGATRAYKERQTQYCNCCN